MGVHVAGKRRAFVCFDFEGQWGMPFAGPYDVVANGERILKVLERHQAVGVFFIVGSLAFEHPRLIKRIASGGHEIGLHGWRHESLAGASGTHLAEVLAGLQRATDEIERLTGRRPVGFRAPYLLYPRFHDEHVYELLASLGYRWASNRELRFPEDLLRPRRSRVRQFGPFAQRFRPLFSGWPSRAAIVALNPWIWRRDPIGVGGVFPRLQWLAGERSPFWRGPLLEIPLYGPLDVTLLGFPRPELSTKPEVLSFAHWALEVSARRSVSHVMYTFHDWVIAGGNRLGLLDSALERLGALDIPTSTVHAAWPEHIAGGATVP